MWARFLRLFSVIFLIFRLWDKCVLLGVLLGQSTWGRIFRIYRLWSLSSLTLLFATWKKIFFELLQIFVSLGLSNPTNPDFSNLSDAFNLFDLAV